jgi:hypothetical protein
MEYGVVYDDDAKGKIRCGLKWGVGSYWLEVD